MSVPAGTKLEGLPPLVRSITASGGGGGLGQEWIEIADVTATGQGLRYVYATTDVDGKPFRVDRAIVVYDALYDGLRLSVNFGSTSSPGNFVPVMDTASAGCACVIDAEIAHCGDINVLKAVMSGNVQEYSPETDALVMQTRHGVTYPITEITVQGDKPFPSGSKIKIIGRTCQ